MPYPACCKDCKLYASDVDGTIDDWTINSGTWLYNAEAPTEDDGLEYPQLEANANGVIINKSTSSSKWNSLTCRINFRRTANGLKIFFNYTDTNNHWYLRVESKKDDLKNAASGSYANFELHTELHKVVSGTDTKMHEDSSDHAFRIANSNQVQGTDFYNDICIYICTSKPEWRNDYLPSDADLIVHYRADLNYRFGDSEYVDATIKDSFNGGGKFGYEALGSPTATEDEEIFISDIHYNKHLDPSATDGDQFCKECTDCIECQQWTSAGTYLSINNDTCIWDGSERRTGIEGIEYNPVTDIVTLEDHGLATGTPVITVESQHGLTQRVIYWIRSLSDDTFAFYPTEADAVADTNRIDLLPNEFPTLSGYLIEQPNPADTELSLSAGDVWTLHRGIHQGTGGIHFKIKSLTGRLRLTRFYVLEDRFLELGDQQFQQSWKNDTIFIEIDTDNNKLKGGWIIRGVEHYAESFDYGTVDPLFLSDSFIQDEDYTFTANDFFHLFQYSDLFGGSGLSLTIKDSNDEDYEAHYSSIGYRTQIFNPLVGFLGFHQVTGSSEIEQFSLTVPTDNYELDESDRKCVRYNCTIARGDQLDKTGTLTDTDTKVFTGGHTSLGVQNPPKSTNTEPNDVLHVELHDNANNFYAKYGGTALRGYSADYSVSFTFGFYGQSFPSSVGDSIYTNDSKFYIYKDDSGNELFFTNFKFIPYEVPSYVESIFGVGDFNVFKGVRVYFELQDDAGTIYEIFDSAFSGPAVTPFDIFQITAVFVGDDMTLISNPITNPVASDTGQFGVMEGNLLRASGLTYPVYPLPFTKEATAKFGMLSDGIETGTDKFIFQNGFRVERHYNYNKGRIGTCGQEIDYPFYDPSEYVKGTLTVTGVSDQSATEFLPFLPLALCNGTYNLRPVRFMQGLSGFGPRTTANPTSPYLLAQAPFYFGAIHADWPDWSRLDEAIPANYPSTSFIGNGVVGFGMSQTNAAGISYFRHIDWFFLTVFSNYLYSSFATQGGYQTFGTGFDGANLTGPDDTIDPSTIDITWNPTSPGGGVGSFHTDTGWSVRLETESF